MKGRLKLLWFTVLTAVSASGLQSCSFRQRQAPDEFCVSVGALIAAADSNFLPVRGKLIRRDTVRQYDSKIIIPNSFNNNIEYEQDVASSFFASLYQGRDSTEAFHRYVAFNYQFMRCFPDWKIADKRKFETMPGYTYTILVQGDVVVYVLLIKENKVARCSVMITVDPENQLFDKIHKGGTVN